MRAVIQRVKSASVDIEGVTNGSIEAGLLVYLGIDQSDTDSDLDWLVRKVPSIRCFEDNAGKMNLSLIDTQGDLLVISQFTLFGNLRKGTRPSFNGSAAPEIAIPLYESFIKKSQDVVQGKVASGIFGADMKVSSINNGPVTLILDTQNKTF